MSYHISYRIIPNHTISYLTITFHSIYHIVPHNITSYHIRKCTQLTRSKRPTVRTPVLTTVPLKSWARSNSGMIMTQRHRSTWGKIRIGDNLSTTNTTLIVSGSEPSLRNGRSCKSPLSPQPISIIYQHQIPTSKKHTALLLQNIRLCGIRTCDSSKSNQGLKSCGQWDHL